MIYFRLPISISCQVLSLWVDLKSFVRFHTAVSASNEGSAQFHDLIKSQELALEDFANVSNVNVFRWLCSHGVKIRGVDAGRGVDKDILRPYLREFGDHVLRVKLSDACDEVVFYLLSIYCRKLVVVYHCGTWLAALSDLLKCNPNVSELRFERLEDEHMKYLNSISCPLLKRLSIEYCPDVTSFPWHNFVGPHLRCLHLDSLAWATSEDLTTIASFCKALEVVALREMNFNDATVAQFTTMCATITGLSLVGNTEITDAGVLSIVRSLRKLKWLSLYDCSALTKAALGYIQKHCKGKLTNIGIDVSTDNVEAVATLLTNCNVSSVGFSLQENLTHTQLNSLFAGGAKVKVLCLRTSRSTDDVLCLVGTHCRRLEELVFSDTDIPPTGLDAAPCALAYGCPRLRLVLMEKESDIPSVARRLWNKVHPQLRFRLESDLPDYNVCSETI